MGFIDYLSWERSLNSSDYSALGKLPLDKVFILYTLKKMHEAGVKDEETWRLFSNKLKDMPLTDWEQLEVSLCCPYDGISTSESETLLERLVEGAKGKGNRETIIHVHVPKAAGTSVNTAFIKKFYHEGVLLPGNNTPLAMRFVFQKLIGEVPFLSTGHLPLNWLVGENRHTSDCFFFMVHREHRNRIDSMRNQIVSSLLSGRFVNRPYAYSKQFYIREMLNRYLFPVKKADVINTMSSSLSNDVANAGDTLRKHNVEIVGLNELKGYIKSEFGINLHHGRKNRTRNISKFLLEIPRSFYALDSRLVKQS